MVAPLARRRRVISCFSARVTGAAGAGRQRRRSAGQHADQQIALTRLIRDFENPLRAFDTTLIGTGWTALVEMNAT
jgi:hypothetical protein